MNRMKIGDTVKVINKHYPRYGSAGKVVSREHTPIGRLWRVRFADENGLYHQEALMILEETMITTKPILDNE